ncbi:hypothetical protein [Pseudoalteromonas sp. T1lg24]|uniref:hypothetical protein n=1 Tax=Pseudoalteromonas sp. T1lg24 TaxID=2077099 RepID=UPI000CF6EC7F|nr:hypothetical protein [Pseudoalteromonas sp. T1lg24]
MNPKSWILIFFGTIFFIFTSVEALKNLFPISQNVTQFKARELERANTSFYTSVFLSSSITHGAMGDDVFRYRNIANLTTVAQTTSVGNYFLLKRAFAKNNKINTVFFFYMPEMLSYSISSKNGKMKSYFRDVFQNESEMLELAPYIDKDNPVKSYFNQTSLYLNNVKFCLFGGGRCYTPREVEAVEVLAAPIEYEKVFQSDMAIKQINYRKRLLKTVQLEEVQRIFIDKMIQFSKDNHLKLVFVLEPLPAQVYKSYILSPQFDELVDITRSSGIEFIDTNNITNFEAEFFYDGRHLAQGKNTDSYQSLIFSYLLDSSANISYGSIKDDLMTLELYWKSPNGVKINHYEKNGVGLSFLNSGGSSYGVTSVDIRAGERLKANLNIKASKNIKARIFIARHCSKKPFEGDYIEAVLTEEAQTLSLEHSFVQDYQCARLQVDIPKSDTAVDVQLSDVSLIKI